MLLFYHLQCWNSSRYMFQQPFAFTGWRVVFHLLQEVNNVRVLPDTRNTTSLFILVSSYALHMQLEPFPSMFHDLAVPHFRPLFLSVPFRSVLWNSHHPLLCGLTILLPPPGTPLAVPVIEMSGTRIHTFAIRVVTPVVSILVMIRHDQGNQLWQALRICHFSARSALAAYSHAHITLTLRDNATSHTAFEAKLNQQYVLDECSALWSEPERVAGCISVS